MLFFLLLPKVKKRGCFFPFLPLGVKKGKGREKELLLPLFTFRGKKGERERELFLKPIAF